MCGVGAIVALSGNIDTPGTLAGKLLLGSKNRGQDGYGLSLRLSDSTIHTFKFPNISPELIEKINSFGDRVTSLITHARYPTSGGKQYNPEYTQPFEEKAVDGRYAFAFNGNIVNADDISQVLLAQGYRVTQDPLLDTEVLKLLIQKQFDAGVSDHRMIAQSINDMIDGCCNMIMLGTGGEVSLSKDRWGFRPLAYKREGDMVISSSESSVLFKMGLSNPSFVKTGEIVEIIPQSGEIIHSGMKLHYPKKKARCFFEAVYFADEKTELWGIPSSHHRYRLGQILSRQDDVFSFSSDDTVVVDVPSSAKHSAQGYADALNLALIPGIIKNPSSKRTFIEQDDKRKEMVKEKYIFIEALRKDIEGKRVILMDDSLVRGTTMSHLVKAFIDFYHPLEVHLRIPSPPIVAPCFYGINMAKISELIAREYFADILHPTPEELHTLARYFHAHSIKYISHGGLAEALQVDVKDICMGCITGNYPTPCGQREYEKQLT